MCVCMSMYAPICAYLLFLQQSSSGTNHEGKHIKQPGLWCQSYYVYSIYTERVYTVSMYTTCYYFLHETTTHCNCNLPPYTYVIESRRWNQADTLTDASGVVCLWGRASCTKPTMIMASQRKRTWLYVLSHTSTPSLWSHHYVSEKVQRLNWIWR